MSGEMARSTMEKTPVPGRLEIEDLGVSIVGPKGTVVKVLDSISLSIADSTTFGIVGESGSGKSMLAKSIVGLLPHNAVVDPASRIRWRGRDLTGLSVRELRSVRGREIGMVFQDPLGSLNPVMKVGSQIAQVVRAHSPVARKDALQRARELLEYVDLSDPESRIRQYPHELSGGMRQRVSLAIALASRPSLLVADEPTTALDVTVQKQILDLLDLVKREQGMSMILISHDLGLVSRRADRVAVMYAGRVVEVGAVDALFRSVRHPYTRALLDSMPSIHGKEAGRLPVIPGYPSDRPVGNGCPFMGRCGSAQPECARERPVLRAVSGDVSHSVACLFPLGTAVGELALERNRRAGERAVESLREA